MPFEYRIHPSVGIARMGNSTDAYFIGREAPIGRFEPVLQKIPDIGVAANVTGGKPFRDKTDRLAKQGARFRIFCYEYPKVGDRKDTEPVVWEVTSADYDIEWKVKVANLKSRDIEDPTAAGVTWQPNTPAEQTFTIPADVGKLKKFAGVPAGRLELGSAFAEAGGQLVVLGSNGASQPIGGLASAKKIGELLWKNWEDDAADGSVTASVTPKASSTKPDKGTGKQSALAATVVIGVPNYGMDVNPPVTLYHLALNHALHNRTSKGKPKFPGPDISYDDNLAAIVEGYTQYIYVSPEARKGTGVSGSRGHQGFPRGFHTSPPVGTAAIVFALLRKPFETKKQKYESYFPGIAPAPLNYAARDDRMPKLQYLAYPELVYSWMQAWSAGIVKKASLGVLPRPMLMDMAHMYSMSGGSFYPGIEVGRVAAEWKKWKADYGATKLHTDIRFVGAVGELTKYLACPWQQDFLLCDNIYWPASRPIEVTQDGTKFYKWMADGAGAVDVDKLRAEWMRLGFIRFQPATNHYFEESRIFGVPP